MEIVAIVFGLAVIAVLLVIRAIQYSIIRKSRMNSQDSQNNSAFVGSTGTRPGGVSWVVGGHAPIPVRRKRFRKGQKK